jgi:pyruvate/2-oxoglutarate dehydrogenase complex dihydrolipoamide acyltransferase (E2) component
MLYPIEVKANIDGGVAEALSALGDRVPTTKRLVWFAEDGDGVANGELRLHDGGVILRFRSGEGPDDSTAKLRPCVLSGWMPPWNAPFENESLEYRIEGDWSGQRRSVAASAVATFGQGSLTQAGGGAPLRKGTLTSQQESMLWLCSDVYAAQRLVVLGPIASTKWEDVPLAGLKVNAERWSVEGLDFLELSIRVKPKDHDSNTDLETRAEKRQAELTAAIADLGLQVATNIDNKTQRVLTALAKKNK